MICGRGHNSRREPCAAGVTLFRVKLAERNAKRFDAMLAEGVTCSRQGGGGAALDAGEF